MKKHVMAALLALALAIGMLQGAALAAKPGGDRVQAGQAGSRLTGVDREVYRVLREEVEKIAGGSRSSTAIRIPDLDALCWSLKELGAEGKDQQTVVAKLDERLEQALDIDRVYTALSADCPYELYWKDLRYCWSYDRVVRGSRAEIRNLTVSIKVAQAYRGDSDTAVSPGKAAQAKRAADSARAIVERYRELPDYEKLEAYRREICALVSYDADAAKAGVPYGDPWQLVYVFDGDPSTNVVCEGYAKAFQYLCDLTRFDGDVTCYTVSGTIDGGSHMWNVVRMEDGQNYMADVTNCDDGAAGAPDKLFLAGASAAEGGRVHTVSRPECGAVYAYGQDQQGLFVDGWLTLSGEDYQYDPAVPRPVVNTGFSDVMPDAYYAEAVAWAVGDGITQGTTDATFSPAELCTHGEILTFLWRAEGRPEGQGWSPIPLSGEEFYAQAVCWAAQEGIIGQDFDPAARCTRADAVGYIWAAFGRPDAPACAFGDVPAGEAYARAVAWAVDRGVTNGDSGATFNPGKVCTRGEIVTFLYRAYH